MTKLGKKLEKEMARILQAEIEIHGEGALIEMSFDMNFTTKVGIKTQAHTKVNFSVVFD